MKTKIDFIDSRIEEKQVYIYSFDKYPLVILTEIKGKDGRGVAFSSRRIHPAGNCKKHEYIKQLTLALARYHSPCELPYSVDRSEDNFYHNEDCVLWGNELATSPNKQSGFLFVTKDKFEDFEREIESIDFRIFDKNLAMAISKKYQPAKDDKKPAELDEIAIVESENEPN